MLVYESVGLVEFCGNLPQNSTIYGLLWEFAEFFRILLIEKGKARQTPIPDIL